MHQSSTPSMFNLLSLRERQLARQAERRAKREAKNAQYAACGLNGPRAVARRKRQEARRAA